MAINGYSRDTRLENETTTRFLAVIFGVVAIIQTILPRATDTTGRVYIQQPTDGMPEFIIAVLAVQSLMLLFTVLIWRKRWKNNIAIGIIIMIFLSIISGALLVADCVTDKEAD